MKENQNEALGQKRGERGSKRSLLKILFAACIIAFAASMLAVSCDKAGGGDNNNNNNANNSGGNGDGGGGAPDTNATIVITNIMTASLDVPPIANPIKVDGTDISIKPTSYGSTSAGNSTNFDDVLAEIDNILTDDNFLRVKAFEFALKGASGGLVMVAPGNVASIGDFEAPTIAATVPADNAGNEGIFLVAAATESGFIAKGLNVYGVFMDTATTPTYAFSHAEVDPIGDGAQPKFYCRAVVPEITTATPAATVTLKGGQKAECFLSYYGYSRPSTHWLGTATRKSFEFAVGAVRTDGKALSEIGITSAEFADGLSKADMAKLAAANKTDYKKFKITLVALNAF